MAVGAAAWRGCRRASPSRCRTPPARRSGRAAPRRVSAPDGVPGGIGGVDHAHVAGLRAVGVADQPVVVDRGAARVRHRSCSTMRTAKPRRASAQAADRPMMPAPRTRAERGCAMPPSYAAPQGRCELSAARTMRPVKLSPGASRRIGPSAASAGRFAASGTCDDGSTQSTARIARREDLQVGRQGARGVHPQASRPARRWSPPRPSRRNGCRGRGTPPRRPRARWSARPRPAGRGRHG